MSLTDLPDGTPQRALKKALTSCRGSFMAVGFFSLFVNILMLLPAIYMLQVYDRVLSSSSESTLLMLTLLAIFLFGVMGGLEWVRGQILVSAGLRLDQLLSAQVFNSLFGHTLASGGSDATAQPLNDLLQLRQFLTGPGLLAFFDVPWLPVYLFVLFMFHPWLGIVGVVAALVLFSLTIWNELSTREDLANANAHALEAEQQTQRNLRNAEVIAAMGMLPRIRARWQDRQNLMLQQQARASRKGGLITAMSKTFRLAVQTLILGLGAYLAIGREITPGVVIAGSILLGRALAPLDQVIAAWRGVVSARSAYQRLDDLLQTHHTQAQPMQLPPPTGAISLQDLVVTPPGASGPVIKGVSLNIEAGTVLAIIGPSAAGKSTLLRAMLGIYPIQRGEVRFDGAEIDQWDRAVLGSSIGYLPQDVELLDGTVSENIARFGDVDADRVVAAAAAAGVHEMILQLDDGYETTLNGNVLSAGQRQRVGLARALYGDPQLIVLDEPNSNLDQVGDAALMRTLMQLKRSGRTVIVVTHRSNLLECVGKILLLVDGELALFGDRDKVMASLQQGPGTNPANRVEPVAAT